jgi:uncharacterized protein YndB with AHSA1/START domain
MAGLVIEREVLIEAPAEVVWRIITEPDQMSQWFADRVELVVEPGAHGYMQFGDQGGERTRLRVSESGHELLAWPDAEKQRYADEHWDGWAEYLDRLAGILAKRQPR